MFSKVYGAAVYGIEASLVTAEADISDGLPGYVLVGYLSSEVREAKERVRISIKNAGYRLPFKKITVNLSPADKRKEGNGFDLPIAVAILAAFGYVASEDTKDIVFAGELSLNGAVNAIPGILPVILAAKQAGKKKCMVPYDNMTEGDLIPEVQVIGVRSLKEAIEYLNGRNPMLGREKTAFHSHRIPACDKDFSEVLGQKTVKRAAEIAVAGGHNLLIIGPPGSGKSMIASRIPGIMPGLSYEEQLEIARVYSVAGMLAKEGGLPKKRPFRSPHHTVTPTALIGGGKYPVPGEISLATGGILFLDELAEFDRKTLETLRQPLEEQEIHIMRLQGAYTYPARFMLVAAMNPCPCGYYPDRNRCRCSSNKIKQYLSRVSNPLLERIDLCVEASPMAYEQLEVKEAGESSAFIQKRVEKARKRQQRRYQKENLTCNAMLSAGQIEKYCILGTECKEYLRDIFDRYSLSARSYHKIIKVARTIADMGERERIGLEDVQEALCFRMAEGKYWNGKVGEIP